MRDTRDKIIDAAMELVIEKGYSDMTTLDIAEKAGVNEVTLFRRFGTKKDIILAALETSRWIPALDANFTDGLVWELQPDLEGFLREYCGKVTPQIVRLSIGLRSPQIFAETAPYIMKVPSSYTDALTAYFAAMQQKGRCKEGDPSTFAISLFAAVLGFVFLQASFGERFPLPEETAFIEMTAATIAKGLEP